MACLLSCLSAPASAEILSRTADRICYDHRPCSAVENPEKDYCLDRATCDPVDHSFLPFIFTIDWPEQGATAFVQYPLSPRKEAFILSRFHSPYDSGDVEAVTMALRPAADQPVLKNLIHMIVTRKGGAVAAEVVSADLATDVERGTVTTYSTCAAP